MPTYDELEVSVGMMIEGTKWTGPVLRANFGEGYGAAALVGNAAGLHLWTLKQAQLPGDASLVPIDSKSRFDYYWDFYVAHTTGTTEIFIIEWRGKKYHASFVDPDMDVQRAAFKIGSPDWSTGGGWKIRQRRVAGFTYNSDGSIDSTPPTAPTSLSITDTTDTTVTIDFTPGTD